MESTTNIMKISSSSWFNKILKTLLLWNFQKLWRAKENQLLNANILWGA